MARQARLCDLITNSLLPFTEKRNCDASKELEKKLLLALSDVYKEIQQLNELNKIEEESSVIHKCVLQKEKSFSEECKCISNIISTMVFFIECESEFIQHVTGNILFSISKSLIQTASIWNKFILLIYLTLETSFTCICGSTFQNKHIAKYENSEMEISSSEIQFFISVLNSTNPKLRWKTALGLFQIIRKILKYLKNEDQNEEIKEKFIYLSMNFVENLSWDLYAKIDSSKSKEILSACMLQFMCSLVGKNDSDDDLFEETNSNLNFKLLDLVPNIISCFLDSSNNCLYQYMRHKMLMLMIRLISHTKLQKGPHIILYLNSLKDHFHDLISEPLQNYEITPESCLQESPFFPRRSQNRHLKRRSLFLFFKFCFCLIQTKEEFYSNIGLSEISEWLKLNYIDKSYMNFCLSFVQLYIDEDDMLFNMFLLLLDGSLTNLQIYDHGNKSDYEETIETFSNIFNPVYLFHIFLLLLDYDHLVIIDYLISKDTGVLCAQYILRCLRVISQSWKSFAEFSVSMRELKLNSQSNKRQKSYQSFENAKGCLISLRNSLEDLDKKKLFPYNPKALLKSLAVLKDLCD